MPLTVVSPFSPINLDEDRRKMRYALAQQVGQAAQQGIGAIDKLGADMQAREKYQTELRFKNAAEERAAAEEARRKAEEIRAGERAKREEEKFGIEKQGIEREREAQDLTQAQGALRFLVKSGLQSGLTPDQITQSAREMPATGALRGDEEVQAEIARQAAEAKALAASLKAAADKAALEKQDTLSKISDRKEQQRIAREKIEAAERLAGAKLSQAQAQANVPSEKLAEDIQKAEKNLKLIDSIIAEAPKYNMGPLIDPMLQVANVVVPESIGQPLYGAADRNAFRQKVYEGLNKAIKEQAGSAVSASEMTRTLQDKLNTRMDDETFARVAKQLRQSIATDIADAKKRATAEGRASLLQSGQQNIDVNNLGLGEAERLLREAGLE